MPKTLFLPRNFDQIARTGLSLLAFSLIAVGICFYFGSDIKVDLSGAVSGSIMLQEPVRFRVSDDYSWRLKASGAVSALFGILIFAGCFLGEKKPDQK